MTYPHLTAILRAHGYWTSSIPDAKLQAAMKRGRELHAAVHILNAGNELDEGWLDRNLRNYDGFLIGADKFRREHKITLHRSEHVVVCEQERYVTTIDEHMALDGADTILEIKTGSRPNAIELQTAGQKRAMKLAGLAIPQTRRVMLLLPGDGSYKLEALLDPRDEDAFVTLARAWWVNKSRGLYD